MQFLWCTGVTHDIFDAMENTYTYHILNYVSFYGGSLVTTNVLNILWIFTWQTFNCQCIVLCHPGTLSENLKITCKICLFFYSNVTDLMSIYRHYRHLRTHSRMYIARCHHIYDFKILRHPKTFKVVQYKTALVPALLYVFYGKRSFVSPWVNMVVQKGSLQKHSFNQ